MPCSCETDKKYFHLHFHRRNRVKSIVSNHFGSNALCYHQLRSSLHQRAPVAGAHGCLSTAAERLFTTEPEPPKAKISLQTQPCSSTGHGMAGWAKQHQKKKSAIGSMTAENESTKLQGPVSSSICTP